LMQIRIWLLIKVMLVFNHRPADPSRLHFEPPQTTITEF
jgi:hypothetical protein